MEDIQDVLTNQYDRLRAAVDELLQEYKIPARVHAIHFNEHLTQPSEHTNIIDGDSNEHSQHPECETECRRNADGQWECRCKKPH